LNDDDLAEFVKLQKDQGRLAQSWSVDAKTIDQETFDLSVKNPNGNEKSPIAARRRSWTRSRAGRREREGAEEDSGAGVKSSWPRKTIGEVCQFREVARHPKQFDRYWRENIPWGLGPRT